ncbi:hypothetical protein [Paenibacillus lautus]|uniref:hypothetical protein n=1 Tax=Paenibacillus lautus TaxID=1401 RepID=UPI003D28A87B
MDKVVLQYYDREQGKAITVTPETPLPMGGGTPTPGSITTNMLADGSVTDEKLATPKINMPASVIPAMVIGTTLESTEMGIVAYSQDPKPDSLAMYSFTGTLTSNAPTQANEVTTKQYVDGKTLSTMSTSEAQTGTATTARAITAAVLAAGAKSALSKKTEIAALTPIADPSTATAEQVAALLNSIIAALKA